MGSLKKLLVFPRIHLGTISCILFIGLPSCFCWIFFYIIINIGKWSSEFCEVDVNGYEASGTVG